MKIIHRVSKWVRLQKKARRESSTSRYHRFRRLLVEPMEDRRLMTVIDLAALTASQGTTLLGAQPNENSGVSVSNVGDVNGDGLPLFASNFNQSLPATDPGPLTFPPPPLPPPSLVASDEEEWFAPLIDDYFEQFDEEEELLLLEEDALRL